MRIHYITRMNFGSSKAHVYNTARTCEALNKIKGHLVTLVSSDDTVRSDIDRQEYFRKNGVIHPFTIISLNSWSRFFAKKHSRIANYLEVVLVNLTLTRYLLTHSSDIDCVYFRDPLTPLPIVIAKYILRKPIFFEIHAVLIKKSTQKLGEYLARISNGLINISYGLNEYYTRINSHSIVSFCAAAEPERFAGVTESKEALRISLNLPEHNIICAYSGNLYRTGNNDSYGIDDIIRAFPLLGKEYMFVGVGKKGNETAELELLAHELGVHDRIKFMPWVGKDVVARYLRAADILMIPAAGARIGNSPTKMFEYLVSGRPIVAAKTGAIEAVLKNERNALVVEYTKPEAWANAIQRLAQDTVLSDQLVKQAQADGALLTWDQRARDIVGFITERTHISS